MKRIGRIVVWCFVLFGFVWATECQAQNPEKISMSLWSPHMAVGDMGNGVKWITYLTYHNRSKVPQSIDWGFLNSKGEVVTLFVEFSDGQKNYSDSILPSRPPIPPGGIERVALYPCPNPKTFGCKPEPLQVGYMNFRLSATWSEILNRYEPNLQVQVTFQAVNQDGTVFSSLSFLTVTDAPGGLHYVLEVASTPKFSAGIALALTDGDKVDAVLTLRNARGETLAAKTIVLERKVQNYTAKMFDEIFPEFAGKLPLGSLNIRFTTSGSFLSRAVVMGIRVDYASNGEARLANLTSFPNP